MERQGRTREKYEGFYLLEGNRRPREAVCREGTSQELAFRIIIGNYFGDWLEGHCISTSGV